jgi:thiamine biosynthesis lipoprotein
VAASRHAAAPGKITGYGCSTRRRHGYGVMGTVFSFVLGESVTEKTVRAVEAELNRIDRLFSTYRPDSQITRLNAGQIRLADCSPEVREVLAACTEAERRTAGWFTPRYSAGIDPTGIVKGWAVRRASDLLIAAGSTRHAINGGGDVLVVGDPAVDEPWRVGVPAGIGRGCPLSVITGHNFSVATSGNCERPGEIRSPVTGTPALTWSAFSVTGPDIVTADAFATAAVAMGRLAVGWLEGVTGYEGIAVDASGRVFTTAGVAAICPA